jgi:hypothetical protein
MSGARFTKKTQPFSVRLTDDERRLLEAKAGGLPLGLFVREQVLSGSGGHKRRRSPRPHADQAKLAELLAALGASRIANNLNQLAHAANTGNLYFDDETKAALRRASDDIHAMRLLLMQALGVKLPTTPPPPESTSQSFARASGRGS